MKASIQLEKIIDEDLQIDDKTGSEITFRGIVRRKDGGKGILFLHYEAEVGLANNELQNIVNEAKNIFNIIDVVAIHRIGNISPGETSLIVKVISEHREEGFKACMFIVDNIKTRVPIWKEDVYEDGTRKWH